MENSYINGSDLLLSIGGKALGHCTSHTLTFNSETKERAVKAPANKAKSAGLWKEKGVSALSISISGEGLRFDGETENGYTELAALWAAGASVEVKAFERSKDTAPYLVGKFVITSIEESSPANDDATYSISLENDGQPDIYGGVTTATE